MSDGIQLVTGGCGYLGGVLVQRLLAAGERVRVLDLQDCAARPEDAELLQGDLREPALLARALGGVSVVHHCAAAVPLIRDPAAFWSVSFGVCFGVSGSTSSFSTTRLATEDTLSPDTNLINRTPCVDLPVA